MNCKKIFVILSVAMFLSACGTQTQSDLYKNTEIVAVESSTLNHAEPESVENIDDLKDSEFISVDENLFNVEINIPKDFTADTTQDDLNTIKERYGLHSVTLNEDGSVTYIMNKNQHQELLKEYRLQINDDLSSMVQSETYPNFTDIKANNDFTEFTITTKSKELDIVESISILQFYIHAGMYGIFSGKEVENVSVVFINADTGEVIYSEDSSSMGSIE